MANIFITSDTHFGHQGVCEFMRADRETKLRPWDTAAEMDEAMVERWNSIVSPTDKVYHLGDVVMNRRALATVGRLNGEKVLIKGNHDIFRLEDYTKYFKDVRAYHILSGMIMSHIPIHEESLGRFGTNIHGHLHANMVMKDGVLHPRYYNECVANHKYGPISLEDVKKEISERGGLTDFIPQWEYPRTET